MPWPYSILDYGVAAVTLVALGFVVYWFVRFLSNHMSKVTEVLDRLVDITRDMADEFHRLTSEMREHRRDHEERP